MESGDLTLAILRDIREEMRGMRAEAVAFRAEQRAFDHQIVARFEVVETTPRDLSEQMLLLEAWAASVRSGSHFPTGDPRGPGVLSIKDTSAYPDM